MNEEILQKLGYNNVAFRMLLKRDAQINPEDIIMPGQKRLINDNNDTSSTEISLENIHQQFQTLVQTIQSLPNEHDGDDYFGKLKRKLISRLFDVGLSIGSLQTQAGMDAEKINNFINDDM
jgi:hypothetical protein